jgi:hypothetical protein
LAATGSTKHLSNRAIFQKHSVKADNTVIAPTSKNIPPVFFLEKQIHNNA